MIDRRLRAARPRAWATRADGYRSRAWPPCRTRRTARTGSRTSLEARHAPTDRHLPPPTCVPSTSSGRLPTELLTSPTQPARGAGPADGLERRPPGADQRASCTFGRAFASGRLGSRRASSTCSGCAPSSDPQPALASDQPAVRDVARGPLSSPVVRPTHARARRGSASSAVVGPSCIAPPDCRPRRAGFPDASQHHSPTARECTPRRRTSGRGRSRARRSRPEEASAAARAGRARRRPGSRPRSAPAGRGRGPRYRTLDVGVEPVADDQRTSRAAAPHPTPRAAPAPASRPPAGSPVRRRAQQRDDEPRTRQQPPLGGDGRVEVAGDPEAAAADRGAASHSTPQESLRVVALHDAAGRSFSASTTDEPSCSTSAWRSPSPPATSTRAPGRSVGQQARRGLRRGDDVVRRRRHAEIGSCPPPTRVGATRCS